ncbi:hypothetical protein K1719_022087 [Acacia pycnantha]|nr:hypothetical protein K1719_022087 [Acacia pycnantha]
MNFLKYWRVNKFLEQCGGWQPSEHSTDQIACKHPQLHNFTSSISASCDLRLSSSLSKSFLLHRGALRLIHEEKLTSPDNSSAFPLFPRFLSHLQILHPGLRISTCAMADMFGFQNMDVSMELESLECGLEFDEVNLLDGLASPPHYDNFHFGALAASHLPLLEQERHGGAQVESSDVTHSAPPLPANNYNRVTAIPSSNVDAELAEAVAGVWEAPIQASTAVSDTLAAAITVSHVPVGPTDDVTAPSPFQPQLLPSTSPLEEWFARGISTSFDQAPPNYPADFLSCQHENIQRLQAMDISMEQETNNETMLGKNMAAPNASCGIINHQNHPSQPSPIHRNPVERGVGITGSGTLSQGQLLSNKQLQTTSWNSRWAQYLQSPPGSALDLRFAPYSLPYDTPAIHRPQQFHPLTSQSGHVPTMQHTFDSPNSMKPPSPTSSRSESSSNCQSPTATVPPNTCEHQPAPRLMLPEPAVSTRPTATILSPNHHPQPTGSSVLSSFINSFGAGPSVPQRYPDIRDYERNFLHSQQTMSHGGFVPQTLGLSPLSGSPLVSDKSNDHSQLWSRRSSVLGSSPFHGSPILPKISLPMMSALSQPITIAPEGSNASSFLGFKPREPSRLPWYPYRSGNHLAPPSTDIFRSNLYSGNFLTPSSSARPPISNRVRRILNLGTTPPKPKAASSSGKKAATSIRSAPQTNADPLQSSQFQDPVERWIKELETVLNKDWNDDDDDDESQPAKKKSASRSARGPAGRREKGGSSSSKRRKSNSADKGKEEAHPIPEEAPKTDEHEVNVLQSPKALQMYQPREVDNTVYDMHYQSTAVLMDPHIRFFRTASIQ